MSRIGGAFPYPVAQIYEGGGRIQLAGGGMFYPPSGEWLIALGTNTNLEVFDPIQQIWVTVTSASDYITTDGFNLRLHNITGCVTSQAITNAGSGATANGIGTAA